MPETVWLIPLKSLDSDARAIKLGDVARMELRRGQAEFVGDPLKMMLMALEDQSRLPYVMEWFGRAVGVLTLQSGAASLAGWPDDDSAWLLRGFLIDRRWQGQGLGRSGAAAAVREAVRLTAALDGGQSGVVLSVNERNKAGISAYASAGFTDHGRYMGGDAGPQRIFYHAFGDGRQEPKSRRQIAST